MPGAGGPSKRERIDLATIERRKPTMRDVCNLAGVSAMTVSRVLAAPDKVSPKTRVKVLKAIEQIGYVPDHNAGSLSSNRSKFVALILPTLTNSNFADTAQGLTEVLDQYGYRPLIGYSSYSQEREEELVRAMLARRPDAIVLVGGIHSKGAMVMLHQSGVPVVETWDRPTQPIDAAIGYSNTEAGRLAAQYLISLGHKKIAALGAREDRPERDFRGEQRLAGFAATLLEAGLSDKLVIRVDSPPISFTQGARAMRELLQQAPDVEAVFVVSDLPAVGAVMECHRQGVRVPEQISIMGFGNFEVGAQCYPSLTTISVDAQQIGRRTGEYLMALLTGNGEKRAEPGLTVDLGFELLVRDSTRAKGG